jgi:hypothetical protein
VFGILKMPEKPEQADVTLSSRKPTIKKKVMQKK